MFVKNRTYLIDPTVPHVFAITWFHYVITVVTQRLVKGGDL